MASRIFKPLTKEEQLRLLQTPRGVDRLKRHLSGLVDLVMERKEVPRQIARRVKLQLLAEIPELAKSYLQQKRTYKFSTMFDWRIRQRLDKLRGD